MNRNELLQILQEETDGFTEQSRLRDDVLDALEKVQKIAINYTRCCTQLLCLDDGFNFLTKGQTYKMISEPDGHYVVIDDFGEERLLWKKYFKILN